MIWSDQNCPTKGAYFAMIFLLKKCVKFIDIFINSYFIHSGYNTAYMTDHEELLFSLDKTVTQLSTTLSLNMSSRSKIDCGHCGQLNMHCPIIGQLDIHCPIIGQLNIHCKII